MCFPLYLTLILCTNAIAKADYEKNELVEANNLTVYDISNRLLTLANIHYDKDRLKELKEKLEKINHYVIDHNLVAEVLTNVTTETRLNETNFYEALNENDHFRFMTTNGTKNLYLKLKEKMTRDDIMKIVAEKGKRKKLVKSARRMMEHGAPKHQDDEKMNNFVDKILAEAPNDPHKLKAKESVYWDPQNELEEMKTYQDSKKSGRRIFKGERTTIRYYPFMASVHLMGRFWCGAVLVGGDLCITSASCLQLMHNNRFFRENPRVLQVRVGSNHSRIGGEMIDVLEVYFHPSYNPRTLKNNLAVVRLRRHLFFRPKSFIKYIAIDYMGHALPATAEVLLLGWGVTKTSQKLSYEPIFLQRKILPVYPNMFCKEVYGEKFVADTMFCAGTLTTGEGACDHDAGGPAILSGRLVGIISFGPSICGFANAPTVFTKIGFFADWIETVNESMAADYLGSARTTTTKKSKLREYLATYKVGKAALEHTTLIEPETKFPDLRVVAADEEIVPFTTTEAPTTTTEPEIETEIEPETEPQPEARLRTRSTRDRIAHSPSEPSAAIGMLKGDRYSDDENWSVDLS